MTHDPFCPVIAGCFCEVPDELCCQCELIGKVRADEREQESARRAAKFGYWHDYRPELP